MTRWKMRMRMVVGIVAIMPILGGLGCSAIGPRSVRDDRFNYNEAGAESSKQQLLLNIIRLRYGEPLYFVEVGSMLSQFHFQAQGAMTHWQNDLHGAFGPALRAAYGVQGDASRQTTVVHGSGHGQRRICNAYIHEGREWFGLRSI